MKLLLVNPNTTASMTEKAASAARSVASSGTEILASNPADGPVSIEDTTMKFLVFRDFWKKFVRVLRLAVRDDHRLFDDTGLDAARCQ